MISFNGGETGHPDGRRAAGSSSFPPDSESRRRRNHEPPKSGIPKRKKTWVHTRLSCKIDYLLRLNHRDRSIASEFFTDDQPESGGSQRTSRRSQKAAIRLCRASGFNDPILNEAQARACISGVHHQL